MSTEPRHRLIETALDRFRMRQSVSAVGAAMIGAIGDPITCVIGSPSRRSNDRIQSSDAWHIGSCTKSITAALWARLVELGYADWDISLMEVFSHHKEIDNGWRHVTIRDALNCRAGLPTNFDDDIFDAAWHDTRPLSEQRADVVERSLRMSPARAGQFLYSNLSYIIVGAAIDRIASATFEDALRLHILEPLQVDSVGFGPPPRIRGHRSRIRFGGIGWLKGPSVDPNETGSDNPLVFSSAGTMHVTLKDWTVLLRVFLDGTEDPILQKDSLEELFHLPISSGSCMASGWMKSDRSLISYIMQGSNTLWSATAALDQDRKRCVVVVCNDGRTRVLNGSVSLATYLMARW